MKKVLSGLLATIGILITAFVIAICVMGYYFGDPCDYEEQEGWW